MLHRDRRRSQRRPTAGAVWRARPIDVHLRDGFSLKLVLLHAGNSSLSIESRPDYVISHDKLVQFLLKIIVLKSQEIGMVLESIEFLLVAVTSFKKRFVALADGV